MSLRPLSYLAAALSCLILFSCVKEQTEPTVFTASPSSLSLTADRQIAEIEVRSDLAWNASLKDGSWCSISATVSKNPSVAGKVNLATSFNPGYSERADTLILVSGTQVCRIPVTQMNIGSVVAPTQLEVQKSVPATFVVHTKEPWSSTLVATEDGDGLSWLEVSPSSADAGHTAVSVTAKSDNINVGDRSAVIRLSLGGGTADVIVSQSQTDALVASGDTVVVGIQGEAFTVEMNHNVTYDVTLSPEASGWISYVRTKSLNKTSESFVAEANTTDSKRFARIFFTSSRLADTVIVVQPGPHFPFMDETAYGVYDFDGRDWKADPGVSQIGLKGYSDSYTFRILYPRVESVVEVSGLRYSYQDGDVAELRVSMLSGDMTSSKNLKAKVLQQDGFTLWLRSEDGTCFIIKTFEGR